MLIRIDAIIKDQATQCRAAMQQEVIDEYAARMEAGDNFPPIEVYGNGKGYYIGDGWYRTFAAEKNGADLINAEVHKGGRREAIKAAVGANADPRAVRRTNADKRKAVEIALKEFPGLSSRQIAELCGVSDPFVGKVRPGSCERLAPENPTKKAPLPRVPEKRTGKDGKQYPAQRSPRSQSAKPYRPSNGSQYARMAIGNLEMIQANDTQRDKAFLMVRKWLDQNQ